MLFNYLSVLQMTRRRGKKSKKTAHVMNPVNSESPPSQFVADEVDDELEKAKQELEAVQDKLDFQKLCNFTLANDHQKALTILELDKN